MVESNEVSNFGSQITGETSIYYFSSESCSFCQEVKDGLYSFLQESSVKINGLSPSTSPTYNDIVTRFKLAYPEAATAFFKSWGTPLMFSFKNGSFAKIEIYGNHKNKNGVAKLFSGLFSFPYIYEFTSEDSLSSFLSEGYPVLILEDATCWEEFFELAKLSSKKSGILIKDKLPASAKKDIEDKYGLGSLLLYKENNVSLESKKQSALALLNSYFND